MTLAGRLLALLVAWCGGVAMWIAAGPVSSLDDKADLAIVLGAAVVDDKPSPVFRERIAHAINLYQQKRVDAIIFTGARSPEDTLSESEAGRAQALAAGIPANDIMIERNSRTTMQNLRESKRLMELRKAHTALLVSDPLHMRRAVSQAISIDIVVNPSPTPTTRYQTWSSKLPFLLRETYYLHHFWLFRE